MSRLPCPVSAALRYGISITTAKHRATRNDLSNSSDTSTLRQPSQARQPRHNHDNKLPIKTRRLKLNPDLIPWLYFPSFQPPLKYNPSSTCHTHTSHKAASLPLISKPQPSSLARVGAETSINLTFRSFFPILWRRRRPPPPPNMPVIRPSHLAHMVKVLL